ncbi:MAG: hypothetical protein ACPG7E_01370 [Marinirhabdus sp.]
MKKLPLIAISVVLFSCCSGNKATKNNGMANDTNQATQQKMTAEGYKSGTIVASTAESDCPYVIKMDGAGPDYLLDPINLDDRYQKDGMKIWVKYSGLRMMNRCEKATPVSITEIQKKEE